MDGRFFFFVSFFLSFCSAEKKKRKGGLGVAGRVESRWRGWGVVVVVGGGRLFYNFPLLDVNTD